MSDFCVEHSNVTMFDKPTQPPPKPERVARLRDDRGESLGTFHSEVRRRRFEREDLHAA